MDAADTPTEVPALAEGAPPNSPSYDSLVESLGLAEHEVAWALWKAHGDVGWDSALATLEQAGIDTAPTDADLNNRVGRFADALAPQYFLVVANGQVKVMYGWKVCRELNAGGSRYAGLMGER